MNTFSEYWLNRFWKIVDNPKNLVILVPLVVTLFVFASIFVGFDLAKYSWLLIFLASAFAALFVSSVFTMYFLNYRTFKEVKKLHASKTLIKKYVMREKIRNLYKSLVKQGTPQRCQIELLSLKGAVDCYLGLCMFLSMEPNEVYEELNDLMSGTHFQMVQEGKVKINFPLLRIYSTENDMYYLSWGNQEIEFGMTRRDTEPTIFYVTKA